VIEIAKKPSSPLFSLNLTMGYESSHTRWHEDSPVSQAPNIFLQIEKGRASAKPRPAIQAPAAQRLPIDKSVPILAANRAKEEKQYDDDKAW